MFLLIMEGNVNVVAVFYAKVFNDKLSQSDVHQCNGKRSLFLNKVSFAE